MELTAFYRLQKRVEMLVNAETKQRLTKMQEIPDDVKFLCSELIQLFYKVEAETGISSMSQSAGSVSESVTYANTSKSEVNDEAARLISDYLSGLTDDNGTPLLYKGAE